MSLDHSKERSPWPVVLLVLWLLYAVGWGAALLTTFPVETRDAVLPSEWGFSAGKALHVLAYAGFAVLTALQPIRLNRRRLLLGLVLLHALGTEFLQQFVERTPSLWDVGLDGLGITLGALVSWSRWWPSQRAETN